MSRRGSPRRASAPSSRTVTGSSSTSRTTTSSWYNRSLSRPMSPFQAARMRSRTCSPRTRWGRSVASRAHSLSSAVGSSAGTSRPTATGAAGSRSRPSSRSSRASRSTGSTSRKGSSRRRWYRAARPTRSRRGCFSAAWCSTTRPVTQSAPTFGSGGSISRAVSSSWSTTISGTRRCGARPSLRTAPSSSSSRDCFDSDRG